MLLGLDKIIEYFKNNVIRVVSINKNIVGFIIYEDALWWDGNLRFVDEIVVTRAFQEKGIGELLMNYIENDARRKKFSRMQLSSHVKAKAFGFYKHLGYNENGFHRLEKKI